ncbi:MAG: hypothetical protein KJ915_12765 [Candidatus Omnitrophica bacterium]|nr:hypothetical protein [Candidatus Omnitrophota bacterium]
MSWTCPHQIKDNFCELRKKECESGAVGCVLSKKFKFIGDQTVPDKIKNKGNIKKYTIKNEKM